MILEKGVNRLRWRFSSNTSFKPNQNDIEALNSVLGWIGSQKKINVLNQDLFAKLYIYELIRFLRQYDTTIFNDIVQKELSQVLDKPLSHFYDTFYEDLVHNQLSKIELKKGLSDEDFKINFTKEKVKAKLEHMVSEAVTQFS